MYEEIRNLAVEAVKMQNKLNMESTLNKIAEMCDAASSGASPNTCDDGPISAGDVLVAADGQEFKVDVVVTESWPASGFGLAPLKKEGCALHPDDVDADMTDEQRARQLAAYERDTAVPKKTRAKVAK